MTPTLDLRPARYDSPDAQALTARVQQYYAAIYGAPDSTPFTAEDFAPPRGGFWIGYADGRPVAMGGWRFSPYVAPPGSRRATEIKRMFVADEARGLGFGRALLTALEDEARAAGADWMVLETGRPQIAAVELYRRSGYVEIPAFGFYAAEPEVLSFGKRLQQERPG